MLYFHNYVEPSAVSILPRNNIREHPDTRDHTKIGLVTLFASIGVASATAFELYTRFKPEEQTQIEYGSHNSSSIEPAHLCFRLVGIVSSLWLAGRAIYSSYSSRENNRLIRELHSSDPVIVRVRSTQVPSN